MLNKILQPSDPMALENFLGMYDIKSFYVRSIEPHIWIEKKVNEFDEVEMISHEIGTIILLTTDRNLGNPITNQLNSYFDKSIRNLTYFESDDGVKTVNIWVRK